MKQQLNQIDALYCRLSRDDEVYGDSSSIQTQKAMLSNYAKQNNLDNPVFFVDDGYSGTNFDRPDFQRLIGLIERGQVRSVLVKDLSRLGREYLQTGHYIENYFPDHDVRFIATEDNVDSLKGHNEFMPFRNIMNEWYARDISKKVRSAYKSKALQGKFTGSFAPYGYHKDPLDKYRLVIDKATAPIVKKMFELSSQGKTAYFICKYLKDNNIPTPKMRVIQEFGVWHSDEVRKHPCTWSEITVKSILKNRTYLGHHVSQRYTPKSFKNRKLVKRPESEWVEVKNTHEGIVDEDVFETVQRELSVKRHSNKKTKPNIFIGRIKCAVCGKSLIVNISKRTPNITCSRYKRYGLEGCTNHYANYNDVYAAVLNAVKDKASKVCSDTDYFLDGLINVLGRNTDNEKKQLEKAIAKAEKRVLEIHSIIKRLYEDNVLGKITDERFRFMSNDYETEQSSLSAELLSQKKLLMSMAEKSDNIHKFVSVVEKYKDLQTLDEAAIIELIDKIVVHEVDKSSGNKVQKIDIYYNFIGCA